MDDSNDMDLALNGDFDSELFDCWDDSAAEQDAEPVVPTTHQAAPSDGSGAVTDQSSSFTVSQAGLQHDKRSASEMDWAGSSSAASSIDVQGRSLDPSTMFRPPTQLHAAASQGSSGGAAQVSVSGSASASEPSFQQMMLSTLANMQPAHQRSLDPRAILSSANCPPHGGGATVSSSAETSDSSSHSNSNNDNSMSQQQQQPPPQQQQQMPMPVQQQQQQVPFDLTSAALFPLAMNALAAGVTLPLPLVLQAAQQAQQAMAQNQPLQAASVPAAAAYPAPSAPQPNSVAGTAPFAVPKTRPRAPPANNANVNASNAVQAPFLNLFDAPAELRANFLNSQRAAGIPLLNDPSQYPFGIAVNGFHPQHSMGGAMQQFHMVESSRHAKNNMKNAKEQRRAQKITTLIENLRMKMEKDGWQVGLNKSKFNTLSWYVHSKQILSSAQQHILMLPLALDSCAEYIRHLVKITEEKEAVVKKTQCDLEATRSKLDDDKIQSDRSDPESTTSSLTVSSGSATHDKKHNQDGGSTPNTCGTNDKKRHGGASEESHERDADDKHKAKRLRYQESTESGTSSNGSDLGYTIKMGNTESVSDLTDSNKGSSSNSGSGSGSGSDEACSEPAPESARNEEGYSEDDVSSDAAVAVRKEDEQHDSTTKHSKKRKHYPSSEQMPTQHGFELDYEEVFLNSNIPQLLATTDGRILAWNKFFLKATGFDQESIKKATIFGLVKCSKLANLFEIVAKALRNKSQPVGNYLATTLPCVKFQACEQRQLYITVSRWAHGVLPLLLVGASDMMTTLPSSR